LFKSIGWALFVVITAVAVSVYYVGKPEVNQDEIPEIVHVGVLPDVGLETLHARYDPLLDYLAGQTGLKFQLVLPTDYNDLVKLLVNDEIDLAYLGGLTFIQSSVNHPVKPLVMRDVDTRFTSLFLVRSDDSADDIHDLKGRSFSFGSQLSTSGHLMPRYFMISKKQLIPEQFFSQVAYSGAHDKTAYQLRDGEIDAGVANAEIIRAMLRDGRIKKNELRVLWETPPYSDYVWAVNEHLNQDVQTRLRDAFLGLDFESKEHHKILMALGAQYFLPAKISDFKPLKEIAESHGLLNPKNK